MGSRSSTARALPATVVVGLIHQPHGIRGEVAVELLSDVPGRLAPGQELLAAGGAAKRTLRVASARPHKGAWLVHFEQVSDRDAAAALRGTILEVEAAAVPPPPAGAYYHYQLLGCRCRDLEAGELGEVVDLLEDGGGLLLVVDGPRGEVLVPFVQRFLVAVDVDAGTVELDLPPGLLEACVFRS